MSDKMDLADRIAIVLRYWSMHPMHFDDLSASFQWDIQWVRAEYDKRKAGSSFAEAHTSASAAWVRKVIAEEGLIGGVTEGSLEAERKRRDGSGCGGAGGEVAGEGCAISPDAGRGDDVSGVRPGDDGGSAGVCGSAPEGGG